MADEDLNRLVDMEEIHSGDAIGEVPGVVPVMAIDNTVIFPFMIAPIIVAVPAVLPVNGAV